MSTDVSTDGKHAKAESRNVRRVRGGKRVQERPRRWSEQASKEGKEGEEEMRSIGEEGGWVGSTDARTNEALEGRKRMRGVGCRKEKDRKVPSEQ